VSLKVRGERVAHYEVRRWEPAYGAPAHRDQRGGFDPSALGVELGVHRQRSADQGIRDVGPV
jgi:hypothetical protein